MEVAQYIIFTDQQLVALSMDGDAVAFEHLFNRYRDSILQIYLSRTGGNREDTHDLLQEAFLKVYLNLSKYNGNYTFGQWVYTIAHNTFIDFVRKRREDISLDNIAGDYSSLIPSAGEPTPEESYINSQQRVQLQQHLEKLTPRYQKLVELRFFKDYSYEEIAAELGLPLGTVKTQIHRAREKLCRSITDDSDILDR